MGAERITIGSGERRQPSFPGAPTAEILIGPDDGRPLAAIHVEVPPGGGMPEHAHGPSHTLLVPLEGEVEVFDADSEQGVRVGPGSIGSIPVGDRVRLENPGEEPARLLVVLAPPEFAQHIAEWPALAATAA